MSILVFFRGCKVFRPVYTALFFICPQHHLRLKFPILISKAASSAILLSDMPHRLDADAVPGAFGGLENGIFLLDFPSKVFST